MRLSFRTTLLSIMLSLLVLTVAAVGVSSYLNARFVAEDLSHQALDQASLRVDHWIRSQLATGESLSRVNANLFGSQQLSVNDFTSIAHYWLAVMEVHPELSYLSIGRTNGETVFVTRLRSGQLSIGQLVRDPQTGHLTLSDYWPADYPKKPYHFDPNRDAGDPRERPYYLAAEKAGHEIWTETYTFLGEQGVADIPGVTCATPIYAADKTLLGVLTADFDLFSLSQFVGALHFGEHGLAFVVELRADGSRRVIAHPDPSILMKDRQGSVVVHELVPAERLSDARVRTFIGQIPAELPAQHDLRQISFRADGRQYVGGYRRLRQAQKDGAPHWLIGLLIPEDEVLGRVNRANLIALMVGIVSLLLAMLGSVYISTQISRPLAGLAADAAAIGQFRLVQAAPVRSAIIEVAQLAGAMEDMKAGLRSFGKFVPTDLVRRVLVSGEEARLGGHRANLTVYFSDIAGFTGVSEKLSPEALVELLGEYLSAMSDEIARTGGTVDKYIGDAVMAFWGAPSPNPAHARAAVEAALNNQARLRELRALWRRAGKPELRARIGLHTGDLVVGNMGSESRLNYTVLGDSVNLASRLEGLNKHYGTSILISESTRDAVKDEVVARPLDRVAVKGKSQGVMIYELLGWKGKVSSQEEERAAHYASALDLYFNRRFTDAAARFDELVTSRAKDLASETLRDRCREFSDSPPADWSGIHEMTEK